MPVVQIKENTIDIILLIESILEFQGLKLHQSSNLTYVLKRQAVYFKQRRKKVFSKIYNAKEKA